MGGQAPGVLSGTRAAVLGHPVAHSLSPFLHRAAYAALGLSGRSYDVHDVREDALAGFVAGLGPEWSGLSLTMPLKRVAFDVAGEVSDLARAVGAVNTLVPSPHGGWYGDNTDVHGVVQALEDVGRGVLAEGDGVPVVLGGGATAASAVGALRALGAGEVHLVVRDTARCDDVRAAAERLGVHLQVHTFAGAVHDAVSVRAVLARDGVPVVVSTVPAAGAGAYMPALVDGLHGAAAGGAHPTLLDVAYDPWPSPAARAWSRLPGAAVASGYDMLVHQAVEQVRLMTGLVPPVAAVRAGGEAELAARAARGSLLA